MTKRLHFGWALHNHQPVGNFPAVFEDIYVRAYEPLVAALERHPTIHLTLHYTGPVLEWLDAQQPTFLERLAALVRRGQVELLTGGFYEPILPIIPEADQLGQIAKMTEFVRQRLGYEPSGLWLAERVWEPTLPATLARAGVDYTIVDDTHFIMAGLRDGELYGYYHTEDQGYPLKVFPIAEVLRESLPWRSVSEVRETLWRMASDAWWPPRVAVMADDGEKFGAWPGTWELVWERGWMDDFLTMLEENADWLHTTPLGDYARQFPDLGRVYLPTAAYVEMMEWALPQVRSAEYGRLRQAISTVGGHDVNGYLHGAAWRGFLAKYPESNHLHKKMLRVHHKVMAALPEAEPERQREMLDELWRGQCNCPYWHGVFGGLYLPDIRAANYRHLLRAENLADAITAGAPRDESEPAPASDAPVAAERVPLRVTRTDFDCDGAPELLIEGPLMNLYVDLREGGAICEWDWRPGAVNVADTLARRPEPYHQRLSQAHGHVAVVPPAERLSVNGAGERSADAVPAVNGAGTHLGEDLAPLVREVASTRASSPALHVAADLVRVKEAGLDRLLQYDWHRRTILLDHVLAPETTFDEYRAARYHDLGDFANQAYTAEVVDTERAAPLVVRLHRAGHVWEGQRSWPVEIEKVLTLPPDRAALRVDYTVTNTSHRPLHARFAVESNWGLLGGGNPAASYQVNGTYPEAAALDAIGEESGVRVVRLANTHLDVAVTIAAQDASLWRFPIQTISNSEAGFERVYQCSCTVLWWPLHLEPGQRWTTTLDVTLGPTG